MALERSDKEPQGCDKKSTQKGGQHLGPLKTALLFHLPCRWADGMALFHSLGFLVVETVGCELAEETQVGGTAMLQDLILGAQPALPRSSAAPAGHAGSSIDSCLQNP